MARLTSIFIDPIYRLLLGPPATHWTGQVLPQTALAGEAPGSRGLVLVADGVGGLDLCGSGLAHVIGAAKVPHSILVFPWGHGFGRWLADLTDVAHRDAMAQSIADSIARFKNDRPAEPVFVVAKSGGSGVVVKALERLDEHAVEQRHPARAGSFAGLRSHSCPPRRALRDGCVLVSFRPDHPGRRHARLRDDRSGSNRQCRTCRVQETTGRTDRRRSSKSLRQAPPGPLAARHGLNGLPGRSPGTRLSFVPEKIRCAALAD